MKKFNHNGFRKRIFIIVTISWILLEHSMFLKLPSVSSSYALWSAKRCFSSYQWSSHWHAWKQFTYDFFEIYFICFSLRYPFCFFFCGRGFGRLVVVSLLDELDVGSPRTRHVAYALPLELVAFGPYLALGDGRVGELPAQTWTILHIELRSILAILGVQLHLIDCA